MYGKDVNGTNINHQFVFNNTWMDPGPVPNTIANFQSVEFSGAKIFASIDNVVVDVFEIP